MSEQETNSSIHAEDFDTDNNPVKDINRKVEPEPQERQADAPDHESPEDSQDEIARLTSELQEQKDKYVRLFAEFDNYRRRTSKESIELRQTAGIEIITSLLDVLDDTDRAEKQLQESDVEKTIKEGILLVFNKFRKVLQSKGLKAIDTLNSDFDVEKDEAISEIEVADKKLKGKVVAEVQKGYLLNNKLIRFAKVVVGK